MQSPHHPVPEASGSDHRAAQNFKQRPALLEPLRLARDELSGHAMACSLKDSQQGFRGLQPTSPDPKNQLSHFPHLAGHTATGRLHRSSTTFQE